MDEFIKSIKEKLNDLTYSPFMSSFTISLIYWNHKYLLIYFGNEKLDTKLRLMSMYTEQPFIINGINIIHPQIMIPIIIALLYVFVYPIIGIVFSATTLLYKSLAKYVEQLINKIILIDKNDEKELIKKIDELQTKEEENQLYRVKMREKIEEYEKIIQSKDAEIKNQNEGHLEETITAQKEFDRNHKEIHELNTKLIEAKNEINSKGERIDNLNQEINMLKDSKEDITKYKDEEINRIIGEKEIIIKNLEEEINKQMDEKAMEVHRLQEELNKAGSIVMQVNENRSIELQAKEAEITKSKDEEINRIKEEKDEIINNMMNEASGLIKEINERDETIKRLINEKQNIN